MDIGKQILDIRKKEGLTQEKFGELFHVTRQTVSNWENEKSYPELQILIAISERFHISLDVLIKEDSNMVKAIDKERKQGLIKKEQIIMDRFTGAGTRILISCAISQENSGQSVVFLLFGMTLIGIGWYKKAIHDKKIRQLLDET